MFLVCQIQGTAQSLTAGTNAAPSPPPTKTNTSPPPPLTNDLPPNLPIKVPVPQKNRKNEGIGSMEAFLHMTKNRSELKNKHVDEGTGQTSNLQNEDETTEVPTGS